MFHDEKLSELIGNAFGQEYVKNGKKDLSAFMGKIYIMRRALHRWAIFVKFEKNIFVVAGAPQVKTVVRSYTRRHVGDKA